MFVCMLIFVPMENLFSLMVTSPLPVNLFVCLEFFVPLEYFLTHLETSPLSVKGCKFWPMLGNFGNWAVSCFFIVPHLLWHRTPENSWHSYQMPGVWQWSCHYLSWLVFELPTFHLRGERFNLLRRRRGSNPR